MALALALDVSPITLLLPGWKPGSAHDPGEMVAVPGTDDPVSAGRWWQWLKADAALPGYTRPQRRFFADARPDWDPGPGAYFKEDEDTHGDN